MRIAYIITAQHSTANVHTHTQLHTTPQEHEAGGTSLTHTHERVSDEAGEAAGERNTKKTQRVKVKGR